MEKHTEQGQECQWDKKHSGQKTYRDSAAVWFTIPAMKKIQDKFGITEETINQNKAVVMLGRMVGINFSPEDFNRTRGVEEPIQAIIPQTAIIPQMVMADTSIPLNQALLVWIKTNYPNYTKELRTQLESCNSKEVVNAHIKAAFPKAFN